MSKKWDYAVFREEMKDPDPDGPHQALFDLNQELGKESFVLEDGIQKQVCQDVFKQALESTDHDVQGAAVKCIPALVKKIREVFLVDAVKRVAEQLTAKKTEHRAIAIISLKYVVEFSPVEYKQCMKTLAMLLIEPLKSTQHEVMLEILDVATDLLRRFGGILIEQHSALQGVFLSALSSNSHSVRKHSISALAALSVHTTDQLFEEVVQGHVIAGIEKQRGEALRKYIQLCSSISRTAGQRVGRFLEKIIPLLLANLDEDKLDQIDDDGERNEVRENILQAFESFVQRCPQQVSSFLPQIVKACKDGMSYDPYYDYDEGDDENEQDDEMADYEDEDNYQDMLEAEADDDDDVSWKVRKAAAKCFSALVYSRGDCLKYVYSAICSEEALKVDQQQETPSQRKCLPERFKEREESVRMDIFKVFSDLLEVTAGVSHETIQGPNSGYGGMSGSYSSSFRVAVESRPEVVHLVQIKDFIVDSIVRAAKDKSTKVKTTCFTLLKSFVSVLGKELESSMTRFLKVVHETLEAKEATSALKTEVLQFLILIMVLVPSSSPEAKAAVLDLLPLVLACVKDKYYRLTFEALRVCSEISMFVVNGPQAQKQSVDLLNEVYSRLSATDVDQEVKDCAILAVGNVLRYGCPKNLLPADLVEKCFKQLLVLIGGDYSRIPVIKTLTVTKDVPLNHELLNNFVSEICSFLRKASRPLRQASLHCLKIQVEKRAADIKPEHLTSTISELAPVLNDSDLHLCHLAVDLCDAILRTTPSMAPTVEELVLPKFISLLQSPLLQGSALESLETTFSTLGPLSKMGYLPLLQKVLGAASVDGENRQVLNSVAAVSACLISKATDDQQQKTVEQYVAYLNSDAQCALGLACLGEVGRYIDLSKNKSVLTAVRSRFSHPKEDIKILAAAALGKITYGSHDALLGGLLESTMKDENDRYLLLRALKETLTGCAPTDDFHPIKQLLPKVLDTCLAFSGSTDEGTRNVVAECLGKLAFLDPSTVVRAMREQVGQGEDCAATLIIAFKYAVAEPHFKCEDLQDDMKFFLTKMAKPEGMDTEQNTRHVKVRRAAVQLFTAAVHSKPEVVRPDLATYMKMLFSQCVIDDDLVRCVNLGPITHKVDDGLELRKSAFECIDILLDGCFVRDSLLDNLNDYMCIAQYLCEGMKKAQGQEIQMLCFIMFAKLSKLPQAHVAVLSSLDAVFVENLVPNIVSRACKECSDVSKGKTPQQLESSYEILITILKMVTAISKVPAADENQLFSNFKQAHLPKIPETVLERANTKE